MRLAWYRNSWSAYWRDESGPRRVALRTDDRDVAAARLLDLEKQQRAEQLGTATVAGIMPLYLADKADTAAVDRARYAWQRLSPVFGHLRPDQVDRPLCRAYQAARRRKGASDGTIIKELSVLRAALRWHDPRTPAIIELPAAPPPRSRHLTRDEYRALREASRAAPHLYLFVVLAYATAGRAQAVLDLTWDRVDFAGGRIALGLGEKRTKGRATVPIIESARLALDAAKPAR
jgi:integrase